MLGQVKLIQVAVTERDQPEKQPEQQPREEEAEREDQQHPAPPDVEQRGEDVLQVLEVALANDATADVAVTRFRDDATSRIGGRQISHRSVTTEFT